MSKKNIILIIILAVVIVGVAVRTFMTEDVFNMNPVPPLQTYAGENGCYPGIVEHIAVSDGTIFTQGQNIMFIMDTNKEIITQLNTETEDFSRHFFSDTLTYKLQNGAEEDMVLAWIDDDRARFTFEYTGAEGETAFCAMEVEGQWVTQEALNRMEAASAAAALQ
jgi:hypothetical protein